MMARKLNPNEARVFEESLQDPAVSLREAEDVGLIERLSVQRDTALVLSPESRLWFGVELPARFDY
jgi:hypothetical protein